MIVLLPLHVCVCRWADGDEAMYTNWSQSSLPSTANDNNQDCVTFAADGWTLHDDCAITDFPFVCKMHRKLDILSTGFYILRQCTPDSIRIVSLPSMSIK